MGSIARKVVDCGVGRWDLMHIRMLIVELVGGSNARKVVDCGVGVGSNGRWDLMHVRC